MADKTKGLSLRDQIRKCDDITVELINVPEWKCKVEMRSPTAAQSYALEEWAIEASGGLGAKDEDAKPDPARFRGMKERYIMCCAYDPSNGKQLFTEEDLEWLQEKNAAVVERLWRVANRLSGLSTDEAAELGKDSSNGETSASGST